MLKGALVMPLLNAQVYNNIGDSESIVARYVMYNFLCDQYRNRRHLRTLRSIANVF